MPLQKKQQNQKVRSEVWIKQTGLLDPGQAQELSHLCSLTCTMYGAPHPPTFLSLISFASCIFNNCHIHPFMDVLLAPDTQNVQTLNSLSSPKDLPTLLHCPHWCSYRLSSKTSNDISFSQDKFPQSRLFPFLQKEFSQNKFQASSVPIE